MNCLDFSWHDTVIQNIVINRSNPGNMDILELLLTDEHGNKWRIIFTEVYAVHLMMNFGVIGDESIYSFEVFEISDKINKIKDTWMSIGVNLEGLKSYQIITAATNSSIEIYSVRECVIELE